MPRAEQERQTAGLGRAQGSMVEISHTKKSHRFAGGRVMGLLHGQL